MSPVSPANRPWRPTVLVVEDDAPVRRSLQLVLLARGFEVRAHGSPRQAIDDPESRRVQCLIADLVMPEVDGLALLATLRADGWRGPAILISGKLDPGLEAQALEAGFDLVLPKPVSEGALAGHVSALIAAG